MYDIKSIEVFAAGRGRKSFIVESPVEAERNYSAYKKAIGEKVMIDGIEYEPIGFEWNVPAFPVYVGERIGIVVRSDDDEQ